ncbi:hypothetical protein ACH5RR_037034, partial [Cinchona calisaya]
VNLVRSSRSTKKGANGSGTPAASSRGTMATLVRDDSRIMGTTTYAAVGDRRLDELMGKAPSLQNARDLDAWERELKIASIPSEPGSNSSFDYKKIRTSGSGDRQSFGLAKGCLGTCSRTEDLSRCPQGPRMAVVVDGQILRGGANSCIGFHFLWRTPSYHQTGAIREERLG